MIRLDGRVKLYRIGTIQNEETGDRTKEIIHSGWQRVALQDVGLGTYYEAYAHQIELTRVIEMRKMSYNQEQFVVIDGPRDPIDAEDLRTAPFSGLELYEVERVAKGTTSQYIKLPLKLCTDLELKSLIANDIWGEYYDPETKQMKSW